ncbi:MAG: tetratricopeptide repeat protein [Leptospiraceae bacterium]|nr:tetratricopeptide repeat protein [Leptospiraceae bacterium]
MLNWVKKAFSAKQIGNGNTSIQAGGDIFLGGYTYNEQPKEPLPKELTSIPAYNPNKLLGRTKKLEEIDSLLSSEDTILLLKGIGGIGKTTILQAYIKTAMYCEKYTHIAWLTISQDIQTHIFQSFSRPEIFQYDDKVAREINYKNLIRKLHDLQGNKLLVLDNANNTQDLRDNIKYIQDLGWKVLISSRGQVPGVKPISIEELPLDKAKELFYRSYQKQKDEPALEQLLELIKRHTLLIEIFAKVANKHPDLDIKGLYQIMKTHDLKQEKLKVNVDVENYILTQQEKQEEIQCREFLLKIFGMEKLDDYEKQALLYFSVLATRDYSFKELNDLFFVNPDENIRLVLDNTYSHLSFFKRKYKILKNFMNIANIISFNKDLNDTKFINLLNGLIEKGWVQEENKNYRLHPLIKEVSLEIQPPTVENCCFFILSLNFLISKDRYNESLLENGLEIIKLLRERHPSVGDIYNQIGISYESKGEYGKAMECFEKRLSIQLETLEDRHPDIAITYHNIGFTYNSQEEYDKGFDYLKKALSIQKDKLEISHPAIADTYCNIGIAYQSKGEIDNALEYYQKALSIRKEKLLELLPAVVNTYNLIGSAYHQNGEQEKALESYKKALSIQKDKLGEKDPNIAGTYINIGKVYVYNCDYDIAIDYYQKAMSILLENFGQWNPSVASTYINMGFLYSHKGEYNTAFQNFEKALSIQLELFREQHQDIIGITYNHTGSLFHKKGEYNNALEYYNKALNIQKKYLGENNLDVATTLCNIGLVYESKGEYDSALEYLNQALSIQKEKSDVKSSLGITYNNIGSVNVHKGEYDKAMEYYEKSLSISLKKKGDRSTSIATDYNNIGEVFRLKNDLDKAFEYYEKAINIRLEKLGGRHPDVATTYNNVGGAFLQKGDYNKALEYFQKAVNKKQN